jgi:hypothetical protein
MNFYYFGIEVPGKEPFELSDMTNIKIPVFDSQ